MTVPPPPLPPPLPQVFLTGSHLVLVMDYCAGGDLSAYVPAGRGLAEAQARWLFQQLAFALEYCHRMGVASRDVKLENCLLEGADSGRPILKLADFGLSASCGGAGGLARGLAGTPAYMAPEVLAAGAPGGPAYDARKADVWSAGVLLHLLLAGRSPFQRPEDAALPCRRQRMRALLGRIARADWAPPPGLSPPAADLLRAMLCPGERSAGAGRAGGCLGLVGRGLGRLRGWDGVVWEAEGVLVGVG